MATKRATAYLLYYHRMPDEMGYSPDLKEADPRMTQMVFDRLFTVWKTPFFANHELQEDPEKSIFNINPRDYDSAKKYTYYHEGKLHDDEYLERAFMRQQYKALLLVLRNTDGSKLYAPIDHESEVSDIEKEFRKHMK